MTIKELNKKKTPIIKIEKSLNKYEHKVLFPEKLDAANKILEKVGLPKTLKRKRA